MINVSRISCVLVLAVAACDASSDPVDQDQERSYTIALGSQVIDTRLAPPEVATPGYTLVKFPGPVTAAQLAALSATARIYTYLPHDTFLVRPIHGAGGAATFRAAPAI